MHFSDRFDEARLESAHKTERNTHVIRSWWKLEPHAGGRRNNIQPFPPAPPTALEKLKGKGKVRGINSPLCHHRVKKQSHSKHTKYQTQRRHFKPCNSDENFAYFSPCLKVKRDTKLSKMHVIPLPSVMCTSLCYQLNTAGSLSNSN